MFTRRDILKIGLASGAYGAFGPARSRRVLADNLPSSMTLSNMSLSLPVVPGTTC